MIAKMMSELAISFRSAAVRAPEDALVDGLPPPHVCLYPLSGCEGLQTPHHTLLVGIAAVADEDLKRHDLDSMPGR
jgi:hypothetical protein